MTGIPTVNEALFDIYEDIDNHLDDTVALLHGAYASVEFCQDDKREIGLICMAQEKLESMQKLLREFYETATKKEAEEKREG